MPGSTCPAGIAKAVLLVTTLHPSQAEDVDKAGRPRTRRYTRSCRGGPLRYRSAVHQSDEGYSVSVPGLPGCWSQGATDAEAVENIKDAIREYLAVVEEQLRGEEIREIEVAV
jgi:predicted RNase H-like HicB family nuclease